MLSDISNCLRPDRASKDWHLVAGAAMEFSQGVGREGGGVRPRDKVSLAARVET